MHYLINAMRKNGEKKIPDSRLRDPDFQVAQFNVNSHITRHV